MRGLIKMSCLTYRSCPAVSLDQTHRANRIWCAVLLVLPPLGQADISPFGKNLSQAASTAPFPAPKAFSRRSWPILLSVWLFFFFRLSGFYFSYHQAGFFVILMPRPAPPKSPFERACLPAPKQPQSVRK
jgi:hypothetical protein